MSCISTRQRISRKRRAENSAKLGGGGAPFGVVSPPRCTFRQHLGAIWLFKKDGSPFVEAQAKEALNFQVSISIYGIVAALLVVLIGLLLIPALFIAHIVLTIIAAKGK